MSLVKGGRGTDREDMSLVMGGQTRLDRGDMSKDKVDERCEKMD
jgi:hypothetical protein